MIATCPSSERYGRELSRKKVQADSRLRAAVSVRGWDRSFESVVSSATETRCPLSPVKGEGHRTPPQKQPDNVSKLLVKGVVWKLSIPGTSQMTAGVRRVRGMGRKLQVMIDERGITIGGNR